MYNQRHCSQCLVGGVTTVSLQGRAGMCLPSVPVLRHLSCSLSLTLLTPAAPTILHTFPFHQSSGSWHPPGSAALWATDPADPAVRWHNGATLRQEKRNKRMRRFYHHFSRSKPEPSTFPHWSQQLAPIPPRLFFCTPFLACIFLKVTWHPCTCSSSTPAFICPFSLLCGL